MDSHRVMEIVNSLGVINVVHRGLPVWIEQLNGEVAEVQYLDSHERTWVPVNELVEADASVLN